MIRKSLKFLHLADLHLGYNFMGGRLKLPYEKAQLRSREQLDVFSCALRLARDEKVDIILIAGDFWEEDQLNSETLAFVHDQLATVDIPVMIAPGNHDYYSPGSHYSDEISRVTIKKSWHSNVHIFKDYDFQHFQSPDLDGVIVTGLAYHSNQPVAVRKFKDPIQLPEADIHLCVVHGSRDDHLPKGKMRTMPFSDAELLSQPFDYVALGHYHSQIGIEDSEGSIRAAYPGSTMALNVDETGMHGCLIGTIHSDGKLRNTGKNACTTEIVFHELDKRRIHRLSVDISGLQYIQAIETKISSVLDQNGVRKEDMALIELTGTYPRGSRINIEDESLKDSCFHLLIDATAVRPEWDIDDIDQGKSLTTEGIFRNRLRAMIDEAVEKNDDAELEKLQNALYYGLDALHDKPITPRKTS
ncbi:metallophosphoesterase [bacterium]|nr:metallophosphoesterase [bacterium]